MKKKINPQHQSEKRGLRALQTYVEELGWIFRPTPNDDYGIDGEIEPVVDDSPTARLLKVQVKSGSSYVRVATTEEFFFLASGNDLDYWTGCSVPVLLVVYDPKTNQVYGKWIQGYLRDNPAARSDRKIWFRRDSDALEPSRANELAQLANATPSAGKLPSCEPHSEVLWSNILPVTSLPLKVFSVPTDCRTGKEVRLLLGDRPKPPCVVKGGRLHSFSDLRDSKNPLLVAATSHEVETTDTLSWQGQPDQERWLVELMNSCLRKKCAHLGLGYDRDHARYYFRAQDRKPVSIRYRALTKMIRRKVAYPYPADAPRFWVHHAVRLKFVRFGSWFLQIDPAYVFTHDGDKMLSGERVGTLATRRKAREYNQSVLNHIVFWREVLSERRSFIQVYPGSGTQALAVAKVFADGLAPFGLREDSRNMTQLEEATEFEVIVDEDRRSEEDQLEAEWSEDQG